MAQLEQLDGFLAAKRANHELYGELLAHVPGIEFMGPQRGTQWNAWFYSILIDESVFGCGREGLMAALAGQHVQTRPVWGSCTLSPPIAIARPGGSRAPTSSCGAP